MPAPTPMTVQLLYAAAVILPSGFVRPVPLFNVPPTDDDVHVIWIPVLVSVTSVLPAVPVTALPGLMVQVVAVVAVAADVPTASAKTIATPLRAEKRPLRIVNSPPIEPHPDSGPITCE